LLVARFKDHRGKRIIAIKEKFNIQDNPDTATNFTTNTKPLKSKEVEER
jgi:hypothetical protein